MSRLADVLTADEYAAVEKVLDFAVSSAPNVGWMKNQTGSFSPSFPSLAKRAIFALNTRGELTLLFGQLNTTADETRFASEWRAELEEVFEHPSWPAYYPILKPAVWAPKVDTFIDTIAWRLDATRNSSVAKSE